MELIGLKKCSTCREVERLLEAQGLTYHYREINVDRPSAQELKTWYQQAGLSSTKKRASGDRWHVSQAPYSVDGSRTGLCRPRCQSLFKPALTLLFPHNKGVKAYEIIT